MVNPAREQNFESIFYIVGAFALLCTVYFVDSAFGDHLRGFKLVALAIGIPIAICHGCFDLDAFRGRKFGVGLLLYGGLSLIFAAAAWLTPVVSLVAFLALSFAHLGGPICRVFFPKRDSRLAALLFSLMVIAFAAITHIDDFARVRNLNNLNQVLFGVPVSTYYGPELLIILIAGSLVSFKLRTLSSDRLAFHLSLMLSCGVFLVAPLAIAFVIFFTCFHALPSLIEKRREPTPSADSFLLFYALSGLLSLLVIVATLKSVDAVGLFNPESVFEPVLFAVAIGIGTTHMIFDEHQARFIKLVLTASRKIYFVNLVRNFQK